MAFHSDRTTHIHSLPLTAVQDFLISISSSLPLLANPCILVLWVAVKSYCAVVFICISFIANDALYYGPPRQVLKNCLF